MLKTLVLYFYSHNEPINNSVTLVFSKVSNNLTTSSISFIMK